MLRDIESAYTVYKEKSFSKAAAKLFVSQPALSATIKKIENQIKLPIFDRSRTPIQLTEAGEYYISSIEKIMSIQKEMKNHFSNMRSAKNGTLNIGGATFFCAHILPTVIQNFQIKYPGYIVNILEGNSRDLTQCLQSNIIDLSIDVDVLDSSVYNSIVWTKEHIILTVPSTFEVNNKLKKYRLTFEDIRNNYYVKAECPQVSMQHFSQEPFLLLKKGNDKYKRAMKICKNAGFNPQVFMYLDQLLTSYYVAKDGKGITFVRANLAHHVEPTSKVCFYKIKDENSIRNINLNYRKNLELSPVSKDFISYITTEYIH